MPQKPSKPACDPWDVNQIEAEAVAAAIKDARQVLTKGGFGTAEPAPAVGGGRSVRG